MTLLDDQTPALAATRPEQAPTLSLAERAAADGVRFLLATFTTLTGKPCSKLVPVAAADALQADGVGFAGYAAGASGQVPADSDIMVLPDVSSYSPLTFLKPGLGLVHCDPYVDGAPHPYSPRLILRAALARAAAVGLDVQAGAEVEYFLVRRDETGAVRIADGRDTQEQPCYDARGVTRMYDHLTAVADAMEGLGWGPYASDHEDGNGQFEQNFTHSDALTTADRVITLRYLISVLAERRDMTATFMPKPFTDRTGSGLHLHLSLWRDGQPTFPGAGNALSPLGNSFIAGILEHAPALHALIAPTVNSYKRLGAATTASGATWAPASFATFGGNDRTHLVRVPDSHRIELRGGDGAANPYLALAGAVAAGLEGIAGEANPAAISGTPPLPRTLLDAVHALEGDPLLRGVLDGVGPGVADYYAQLKREEFYTWHSQVSAWEIDHYLTAV